MSHSYIIGNGIVTDGFSFLIDRGAIEIENGVIKKIGKSGAIETGNKEFIDLQGRLVLPGLLNPHQHLYSSLATGLAPRGRTSHFTQILENLWWQLDGNLDAESIYYSALCGLMDSVAFGVTTVYDHHASMNYINGSLSIIEKALRESGIKGLLCFELSDRNGRNNLREQLEENITFWEKHRKDQTVRGILGMHANFTLSNDTMACIAKTKPDELPLHIHCGEDRTDLQYCLDKGFAGPVDRLQKYGLLSHNALLAHCIHLSFRDYELIREVEPIIVSNPESNANNKVGTMDLSRIKRYCLGTDGMTGNILGTLRSHFLLRKGKIDHPSDIIFKYPAEIVERFFPDSGTLAVNKSADIAVTDYIPATDISLDNLFYHLVFGVEGQKMFMTIARGKVLYRNGQFRRLNAVELLHKIKAAARRLHGKFYA